MTTNGIDTEPPKASAISEEELQKKTAFEILQHANGASDFLDKKNALFFFNIALQKAPDIPDIYNDRALMQHIRFANVLDALKDYALALEKNPTFFPSLFARATLYFSIKEYTLALHAYSHALIYSTDIFFSQTIHLQKAQIYQNLEEYQSATEEYNNAIALVPTFGRAYFKRALFYYTLSEYGNALLNCNKSLLYNSTCQESLLLRSYIFTILGDYSLALEDIQKSIASEYYPEELYSWYNTLNHALTIVTEYETISTNGTITLEDFKEYIHALTILLQPQQIAKQIHNNPLYTHYKSSSFLYFLAQTFISLSSYDEALSFVNEAIDLSPNANVSYFLLRASIYTRLQEYTHAIQDLLLLLELESEDTPYFDAYSLLAENYVALQEYQYALHCYLILIQHDEYDFDSRKKYAYLYYSLGEFQNAIAELEYLLEFDTSDKEVYKYLALSQMNLSWFRAAALSFTSYLTHGTTDHQIFYYRSICYLNRQQFELSLDDITISLLFYPNSIEYLLHRITLYNTLQKYTLALQDISLYKDIVTQNEDAELILYAEELLAYTHTLITSTTKIDSTIMHFTK